MFWVFFNKQQLSKTLLDILADINGSLVSFSEPLGTVSSAPPTTGMFYSFFKLSGKIKIFVYFLFTFTFLQWSTGKAKSMRWKVLFFLLINTRFDILARIWWSICISKSHRIFMQLIFKDRFWFVLILFFVRMSKV